MNLEDFISQSLSQIARGIEKANKELEDSQALVSPEGVTGVKRESKYGSLQVDANTWLKVSEISFDVAVTATSGTESGGRLGISVSGINIGANGKSNHGDTSESRIQFSVPMVLPQAKYKK
ncbi:TPA: hypothetical protein NG611_004530 [Vibrio parahaemolyticus]|nr:hypothetical protein [Vibrio parahaemolyticus]EKB7282026.1 hypothetical protein [Vibrio parahaemolyticus]MBE5196175.1 hypothetical protein [Vibrio parahaemolyticus]MDF4395644.1 hypothetical protein [Vibrio parahaemolyticus]HCE1484109.1 hypothetical protein [Vibrio parahaemolyticus]